MPAHNESDSLARVVQSVSAALAGRTHEILVVDDGSSDSTWFTVKALHENIPAVGGIRLTRNFGHQAALAAGLKGARGAAVVMMDSDGQHPPELLPAMLRLWEEGHVVVQTVRTDAHHEGWLKRSTSRSFYYFWSALSGVNVQRGTADFRLVDRRVLDCALASGGSLSYLRGLIPWLGFPVTYLPFEASRRLGGRPAYTWRRSLRLCLDGVTGFSVVPLRLAIGLGVLVSAVSFSYLCYVLAVWLLSDRVVSGWASTAGLVALIGGIQLLTIGVLGEYVGRIFMRTTDRPQFVVIEEVPSAAADVANDADRSITLESAAVPAAKVIRF
jgi:dolichol-phosphate mannosyltransferase